MDEQEELLIDCLKDKIDSTFPDASMRITFSTVFLTSTKKGLSLSLQREAGITIFLKGRDIRINFFC